MSSYIAWASCLRIMTPGASRTLRDDDAAAVNLSKVLQPPDRIGIDGSTHVSCHKPVGVDVLKIALDDRAVIRP